MFSYDVKPQKWWNYPNFTGILPYNNIIEEIPTPSIDQPSMYLRYELNLSDNEKYYGYYINIKFLSGIIFTVNGKEMCRANLPEYIYIIYSGEINEHTYASELKVNDRCDVILPIKDFKETVVLGLELHMNETNDDDFPKYVSVFAMGIKGDNDRCKSVTSLLSTNIISSSNKGICQSSECFVDNAFDQDYYTTWRDTYISIENTSFVEFEFKGSAYINKVGFVRDDELNFNYPLQTNMSGINIENNKIVLKEINDIYYFNDNEDKFSLFNGNINEDYYKEFRIDISESNNGSYDGMEIQEIEFYLCNNTSCEESIDAEIPSGINDDLLILNCSESNEGYRKVYCNENGNWIELENTCNDKPKKIYGIDSKAISVGIPHKICMFGVSGSNVEYSINTEISGMTLDKKTGCLKGIPIITGTYIYTLHASNDQGEISHSFYLIFEESLYPLIKKRYYPITLVVGNKYNDLILFELSSYNNITVSVDSILYNLIRFTW